MFTRIYLHIPFCRSKCPYCAFVSSQTQTVPADYAELLLAEMRLAAALPARHTPLESIYFGGGTPSLLEPSSVATILAQAKDLFGLAANAEITLEANPGTVDAMRLAAFRKAGINRLSLGVQSLDDRLLKTLGRIHTARQALDAFSAARIAGFDNIGIDLIHALPGQSERMWQADLEQALRIAPEHLSVYGLSVEEGTPYADRYADNEELLPDQDLAAEMFELADEVLTTHGYEHYEIANYALPGRRSRHNSGYWHRDGYLGLGRGAHTFLRDTPYGTRCSNTPDPDEYRNEICNGALPWRDISILSSEDAMAEYMFLGLRMADGIGFNAFEQEFGVPLDQVYGETTRGFAQAGLLEITNHRVRLTRRGMLLSNQVFSKFLP